jgi:hypothetical protein
MLITEQEANDWLPCDSPSPWLSPLPLHDMQSDPKHIDTPESPEHWQDESSDSDCSSDSEDGSLLEVSVNLSSTTLEPSSPKYGSLFCWEGPPIAESNALGLIFTSEAVVLKAQGVATSTPQAESLRAPPHHQDARSCDGPSQKHQAQREHLAPQPDSPADDTLAGRRPQDICLRADVSDASGPEVSRHNREAAQVDKRALQIFQELCSFPCQRAYPYFESRKPGRDDDLEDWQSCRDPGQLEGATAMNAQPSDWELLRAPRIRPIPLPEEEGDEHLYSGPDLGGWLNGTLDGVPKTMTLCVLDVALPVPFCPS